MNKETLSYRIPDSNNKIEVLFQDKNFWLTQNALAGLFHVKVSEINQHLKDLFESGELSEDSVRSVLITTSGDGTTGRNKYYNLDAIIAAGYRLNTYKTTRFRIWANKTLKKLVMKKLLPAKRKLQHKSDTNIIQQSHPESEARYRSIFNSATEAFIVYDLDGSIVEANPQACKMHGYSYEDLLALTAKEIIHPDCHHLFDQFQKDVRSNRPFHTGH